LLIGIRPQEAAVTVDLDTMDVSQISLNRRNMTWTR
jgi:hypothetical protein